MGSLKVVDKRKKKKTVVTKVNGKVSFQDKLKQIQDKKTK